MKNELTRKQIFSVPCPTCGAAIGKPCGLYSGIGKRNEPHLERKNRANASRGQVTGNYRPVLA
jgi:hypothetical protein